MIIIYSVTHSTGTHFSHTELRSKTSGKNDIVSKPQPITILVIENTLFIPKT